jgi:hypothetical protein
LSNIQEFNGNHPVPNLFPRDENTVFLNKRLIFQGRPVIQRQKNVRSNDRRINWFFADSDGITVLASPDSGFELLPGEYGIAVPGNDFRKYFPNGLYAFTGRSGDDYIEILHHLIFPFLPGQVFAHFKSQLVVR